MPMEIAVQNIDACVHDEQQCCDMRQTNKKDGGDSRHERGVTTGRVGIMVSQTNKTTELVIRM